LPSASPSDHDDAKPSQPTPRPPSRTSLPRRRSCRKEKKEKNGEDERNGCCTVEKEGKLKRKEGEGYGFNRKETARTRSTSQLRAKEG
jgi:hypothetical protein